MSTAAQQARRKIATPKGRLNRSTTPTSTSNTFGAGQQHQQQQSFSSAPPSTSSSGLFNFGSASQSFPPPQQPQQQVSFAPTSSSFTFGSNNDSSAFNNPFASANGMTNGASNDADAMQESPQKKPNSNPFGGFGMSSTTETVNSNGIGSGTGTGTSSIGFGFGQPSQPATTSASSGQGLFGASQPQTNGFSFGGPSTTQSSSAPSLFGQSTPATTSAPLFGGQTTSSSSGTSLFGTASQPSTSTAPSFGGFGSTSGTSTPASTAAPTFSFGQPAIQEQKPEETPKANLFDFGSTSSFGKPATETAPPATEPSKPAFSFGQPASAAVSQPESTPSKTPAFSFGSTTPQPEPASAPPKSTGFAFGQPTSSQPATTTNLYGSLTKSDTSAAPLFGSKPTQAAEPSSSTPAADATPSADDAATPSNPFASLFASNKPATDTSAEASKPKPVFSFGQPSPAAATTTAAPSKSSSSSGFFSAVKPPASSSAPSNDLFNLNKPAPPQSAALGASTTAEPSSMFGSSLQSSAPTLTANAGSTPFKPFASQTDKNKSSSTPSSGDDQPAKKRLFTGSSTPQSMAKSADLEEQSRPASQVKGIINRAVSTEGPPQIPRYLDGEKYKEYDENWRLKALNRRFKAYVATVDPDKHDFLSVVQNYLDHRASIGASLLEGYERPKLSAAGSKRKATDVDDMQDAAEQNKKSRPTENNKAAATLKPFQAPSNASAGPGSNLHSSFKPAAPKSTTPPSSPPKVSQAPAQFKPSFGSTSSGSTNFANSFAAAAAASKKKEEALEREKRKAEDFDSDEDDEEAWNKKYEEEQAAKKSKLEALSGQKFGFTPSVSSSRSNSPFTFAAQPVKSIESDGPSSGFTKEAPISIESDVSGSHSDSQESGQSGDSGAEQDENEGGSDEGEDEDEEEDKGEEIPDLEPEQSLFSRVSKDTSKPIMQPAANNTFGSSVMFANIGQSTPSAPSFSPVTPAAKPKGDFVPSKTFNFTPTPASSTPAFGALKDGPIPGEGLFGSRPSTPQPLGSSEKSTNPFSGAFGAGKSFGSSISGSDNTWKAGSPIKFNGDKSDDKEAPSVEVTAATPPAKDPKPFAGLFGAATSSAATNPLISNGNFTGFNFGKPSSSAPAPGFLSATNHLTADSIASGLSSRGSSPGLVSEAESVATDNTEDYSAEPQASLMNSGAGEENEDILYESRASLMRRYKKSDLPEKTKLVEGWNKIGTGNVKVLKDKDSAKCRIVFRAEPSANVLLNTRLMSGANYSSLAVGKNGGVQFLMPAEEGAPMKFMMLKVKTKDDSDRLAKIMEENKTT